MFSQDPIRRTLVMSAIWAEPVVARQTPFVFECYQESRGESRGVSREVSRWVRQRLSRDHWCLALTAIPETAMPHSVKSHGMD